MVVHGQGYLRLGERRLRHAGEVVRAGRQPHRAAGGYVLLFTASPAVALPAAVAVGMSGSMALVIAQTALQRAIPGAALGRVSAVFLTAEAAATLAGRRAVPRPGGGPDGGGRRGVATPARRGGLRTIPRTTPEDRVQVQPAGRCGPGGTAPSIRGMSTPVLADTEVRTWPATVRPYLLGGLAALSVGAAAIHFAVVFEHFAEYTLYGVFFLVISWAQLIWPAVLLWRPSRLWLCAGHRRERRHHRGVRGVAHRRPAVRS